MFVVGAGAAGDGDGQEGRGQQRVGREIEDANRTRLLQNEQSRGVAWRVGDERWKRQPSGDSVGAHVDDLRISGRRDRESGSSEGRGDEGVSSLFQHG